MNTPWRNTSKAVFPCVFFLFLIDPQHAVAGPPDGRNRPVVPQQAGPNIDQSKLDPKKDPITNSITVTEIEITQGVQDTNQAVPIDVGRRTWVRVSFDVTTASGWGQQSGRISVTAADGTNQTVDATRSISVLDQWNGNLELKRNWIDLSLVFEIPANLVQAGNLTVRLDKAFDMYRDSAEITCNNCQNLSQVVNVGTTAPLRLTVIGLSYAANNQNFTPRQLDYDLVPAWMKRAYPVSDVIYNTRAVPATNAWPFDCNQANAQIAQIRANDINGGTDARTHYFGMVYDGGGFMRGCAAQIPGVPTPSAPASGPTGAGTWGWDTDGSYGDWYTAHEVGHTLGRSHVGGICGEAGVDPNYPFAGGQLSNAASTFVGFDAGDDAFNIVHQALPGKVSGTPASPVSIHNDVMSYCTYQWVSSYTYTNLQARIIAENNLAPGPALLGGVKPALASESLMSGRMMHVLAKINNGWSIGEIVSLTPVTRASANSAPTADAPVIETLGAGGKTLQRYPVAVFQSTDQGKANSGHPSGLINAAIPVDDSVLGLRITVAGKTLAERMSGAARPTIKAVTKGNAAGPGRLTLSPGEPPTVLSWTGQHAETKPLTYTVQVSTDGGATWETVAVGLTTPRVAIGAEHLSARRRMMALSDRPIKYKVIASDGFHSTEAVGLLR